MIFHLGNFKRTKLDNVFQYTDGDEVKFFDFNQLTELEVNENDFVVLNDNNLKIKRDDLEFRRFYTTVPEGYKRLVQYGNHTFHERIYYYNKEEYFLLFPYYPRNTHRKYLSSWSVSYPHFSYYI